MAYEFRCTDAGASCGWSVRAESQEELLQKLSDHLRTKHKVKHVSKTLQNFALKVAHQR